MYNLGNLLGKLGRHHEALELEVKALELRKKIFPENHPAIGKINLRKQHMIIGPRAH
jgi:hypothetical protein